MRGKSPENNEEPILNVVGDLVALGPLRRDLLGIAKAHLSLVNKSTRDS
jgi:hypothetical protein